MQATRITGYSGTATGSSIRYTASVSSILNFRFATLTTTRRMPAHAGLASGSLPNRSGKRPVGKRVRYPGMLTLPCTRALLETLTGWCRCLVVCGSGRVRVMRPIQDTARQKAPSANTTASSCVTSWCCAAAPVLRRPDMPVRVIAISSIPKTSGSSQAFAWLMIRDRVLE